jgi:hypothetical protein
MGDHRVLDHDGQTKETNNSVAGAGLSFSLFAKADSTSGLCSGVLMFQASALRLPRMRDGGKVAQAGEVE